MFSAMPNQKRGATSDRLIDPSFNETVPVDNPLLTSQRHNIPSNRKVNLPIPE